MRVFLIKFFGAFLKIRFSALFSGLLRAGLRIFCSNGDLFLCLLFYSFCRSSVSNLMTDESSYFVTLPRIFRLCFVLYVTFAVVDCSHLCSTDACFSTSSFCKLTSGYGVSFRTTLYKATIQPTYKNARITQCSSCGVGIVKVREYEKISIY